MAHDGTGGWRRPSSSPPSGGERDELRRRIRAQRRALTPDAVELASIAIARLARRHHLLLAGRRIAAYLAYANEVGLDHLIERAVEHGCEVYLPVITDFERRRMQFRRFTPGARLARNRYGILEPTPDEPTISVRRLDVVFAPLVAVDDRGSRLGSGAGFYDRSLQHLRAGRIWRRPHLIGVAYEFQRVPHLDAAAWDVPLDALLTERTFLRFRRT